MPGANVLEVSLVAFTADKLEIKVKNTSDKALEQTLEIEIYPPKYLVTSEIKAAAIAATTSTKPVGVATLEKVVSHPEGWSVWAKREASDSSSPILLLNDMDQEGDDVKPPVKLAAGADFVIRIPLDPDANHADVELPYSYQHGTDTTARVDGKLKLKLETIDWEPDVTLWTDHKTPTAVDPKVPVKIFWAIKDGVSATLRGPLPGGNTELELSPNPKSDFKISEGFLAIYVVSSMTYALHAEVKHPKGKPNVHVVRMLTLDTLRNKYLSVEPRPPKVLPNGLIEIHWAAWGVNEVELAVSNHTTRAIELTRQTLGRFYEGSGVMRVSARRINTETVIMNGTPSGQKTKIVSVITWEKLQKPDVTGQPRGLAVLGSKIGLLTSEGLYIAEVGELDSEHAVSKLMFSKHAAVTPVPPPSLPSWAALTAVDGRFICVGRNQQNTEMELAPFTINGEPDDIPPVTLPGKTRLIALGFPLTSFDLVGFGKRAYLVVELKGAQTTYRHAYSVGFDRATKKADLRVEPLLETLIGYRLVVFDNALYALNRTTGRMLRFELTKDGKLDRPLEAASAVRARGLGAKESMVQTGQLVPVGRVLVVMNPTSVPSVASLEHFGLHNVLGYRITKPPEVDPNTIPQDLVYGQMGLCAMVTLSPNTQS